MTKTGKHKDSKLLELLLHKTGPSIQMTWSAKGHTPWRDDYKRYSVPVDVLVSRGELIREKLRKFEAIDTGNDDDTLLEPRLHELATAGEELYGALFEGDEETGSTAAEVRAWFEKTVVASPEEWRIQVVHSDYDAPVIPWGLVFTPLPENGRIGDLGTDWQDYRNFWVHAFGLACCGPHRGAEKDFEQIDGEEAVLALTLKVEDSLVNGYTTDDAKLKDYVEQVSTNMERFELFPDDNSQRDIFWYVYLNEGKGGYMIDGDRIDAADIRSMVKARKSTVTIMFLDGNAVIQGDRGVRWVNAILQNGRSGVIAAETDIRSPVINDHGWKFWKHIVTPPKNTSLIDAIDQARQQHWPRSLLYGVYCDPLRISFTPPFDSEVEKAERFLDYIRAELDDDRGA